MRVWSEGVREAQSTEAASWREKLNARLQCVSEEGRGVVYLMVPLNSGDEGKQHLEEGGGILEGLLLGRGQLSKTEGRQFGQHWTQL